jgi:hypothetical protein
VQRSGRDCSAPDAKNLTGIPEEPEVELSLTAIRSLGRKSGPSSTICFTTVPRSRMGSDESVTAESFRAPIRCRQKVERSAACLIRLSIWPFASARAQADFLSRSLQCR